MLFRNDRALSRGDNTPGVMFLKGTIMQRYIMKSSQVECCTPETQKGHSEQRQPWKEKEPHVDYTWRDSVGEALRMMTVSLSTFTYLWTLPR